jgi:diadenosine tetraphosphate (Ap4A) HIT family hydrolase
MSACSHPSRPGQPTSPTPHEAALPRGRFYEGEAGFRAGLFSFVAMSSCLAPGHVYDRHVRRREVDWNELRQQLGGRCFICELVAGNPGYSHHIVYENETAVAFLNRYPAFYGHVLVAPREHREEVTSDFSSDEYVALQRLVHRVGEAVRRVVPTERLCVLSLGSQEGNRHVHWHLAPLPPGVPVEEQQLAALNRSDVIDLTDAEMAALAEQLRKALAEPA